MEDVEDTDLEMDANDFMNTKPWDTDHIRRNTCAITIWNAKANTLTMAGNKR